MTNRTLRLVTFYGVAGFATGALLTARNSADLARMATGLILGVTLGYALDLRLRIKNR